MEGYLNSFMWIRDLRTLEQTTQGSIKKFIKDWISKNKYYSESSWKDEILSKNL